MMNPEDLLQERLTRLEAGEPLEACLAGLPEEIADLLKMAAALRSISYPSRAAASAAEQREHLLRAAQERKTMSSKLPARSPRIVEQIRPRLAWLAALPRPAALALTGVIVAAVVAAALLLRPSSPAPGGERFVQYLPALQGVLSAPDPHSAVLSQARGIVEVLAANGAWTEVKTGQLVQAGQRVRTGSLSGATLLLYDGSQAHLGPVTEVSVDELDANTPAGPRVVRLTQWLGETDHDVTPSADAASRYEVRTPSGTGTARGTSFHVSVSASLTTRISVEEGAVAATSLNVTVIVIAGQVTTIHAGAPPAEPVFRVTGQGVVSQIGETWIIGGQEFLTDDDTVIVGNPQVGDLAAVEGHLRADGARVADVIALLRRAQEDRFAFTGTVDSIGDTMWMISGRAVSVTVETETETGIEIGDLVTVDGVILPGGTLSAEHIRLAEAGLPFEFTGVVEAIAGGTWTISGIEITVDSNTAIDDDASEGDIVKVRGRILPDGAWLAEEIKRAEEDERRFEFTGTVESTGLWKVSGIEFETDDQTETDANIQIGDRVKVEGRVLDDGTWLAERITLLDDESLHFEFIGEVDGIDPWIVGGVAISVTNETETDDDIEIGDLVRVKGRILPGGTLLAEQIELFDDGELGCLETRAIVTSVSGDQLVLHNGQVIQLVEDTKIQIHFKDNGKGKLKVKVKDDGQIEADSVVIIHICTREDGTIVVVSITIIHVHPRDLLPPELCINPAGKVMRCPPGNPPPFRPVGDEDEDDE